MARADMRLLVAATIAIFIVMEPVSWMMASVSPCIINAENYGAYYANHNECPTLHVFLIVLVASIFKHLGDPNWVIADFTVVLAFSTIGLWVVTWKSSVRQSRDMKGAIAAAQDANRIASENAITGRRAWLTLEDVELMPGSKFIELGMVLKVSATTKNTGHTPATNCWFDFGTHFTTVETPYPAAVDAFKRNAKWKTDAIGGQIIFPGDVCTQRQIWQVRKDDMVFRTRGKVGPQFIDFMLSLVWVTR